MAVNAINRLIEHAQDFAKGAFLKKLELCIDKDGKVTGYGKFLAREIMYFDRNQVISVTPCTFDDIKVFLEGNGIMSILNFFSTKLFNESYSEHARPTTIAYDEDKNLLTITFSNQKEEASISLKYSLCNGKIISERLSCLEWSAPTIKLDSTNYHIRRSPKYRVAS